MAKSEIILPNGDKVTGNWSTEETMASILKVLEAKYGKTGKGGTEKKEEAEKVKKSKLATKLQDSYNKRIKKAQESIQKLNAATKKQLEQHPKVAKALDVMADGTTLAGRGLAKLGGRAKDLHDDLDNLGGSAQNTSNSFFTLVGGAGALGTAFGFIAGLIDQYADFQVAAIQTGFGFSSELTNTRMEVGKLGLNMAQYGRILTENGEAIRSLGRTGLESSNEFIKLIDNVKTTAYQFGMFGMTTEEVAAAVGAQLNVARLQGFQGQQATAAITESFNELNHQVLAYSKLTGRERREIMRNNLATREGSEALIANLAQYGPQAQASYDAVMSSLAGVFGKRGGDELTGLLDAEFSQFFLGGMEQMSQDQLTALSFVPGLKEQIEATREQVMANINDPKEVGKIMLESSREIGGILQANQDKLAKDAVMYADQSYGSILASLLAASQEANNFLMRTPEEIEAALGPLESNEKNLLLLRDRIDTLQNTFMGAILKGMGIDNLEDLANEGTFNGLMSGIDSFGDTLASFRENVMAVSDFFGGGPTGLIAIMTAGAVALFAANSLFTMAMVAGANKVWGTLALSSAAGGLGKGAGWLSKLGPFAKKIPWLGTAIAAGSGIMDQDYKDAGYNWGDRAALGVFEGGADVVDGIWNLITGAGGVVGLGPGMNNNTDLSGALKSWATDPTVASWMQPYNWGNEPLTATPAFDPSVSSDGHYVPSSLTGIVQGATHGANGDVNVGMDASNAWRFSNSDNAILRQMAAALEEANRINKRLLDAAENQ